MAPEGVCIHCGNRVGPLWRQYSPAVLRLTQCKRCGNIADEYLEYDPVVVMIDLVLLSNAAFRHVLYNTSFKGHWKLFIILLILETYIEWESSYLYKNVEPEIVKNIITNDSFLHIFNNSYSLNVWGAFFNGNGNNLAIRDNLFSDNDDQFIFQMKLYLTFIRLLVATVVFSVVAYVLTICSGVSSLQLEKVDCVLFSKAFTLASSGIFLLLPALIWGSERDRTMHYLLVLGYKFWKLTNVHSVIFECNKVTSILIILFAHIIKVYISSKLKILTFYLL